MCIHRVNADFQHRRHFLGYFTVRQQLQNFAFSCCQQIERIGGLLVFVEDGTGNFRAQESATLRDGANGTQQVLVNPLFQKVAPRACA